MWSARLRVQARIDLIKQAFRGDFSGLTVVVLDALDKGIQVEFALFGVPPA